MPGPHKGVSTQHNKQQLLAKPQHQPSERDQQAREKLRQKAKIKSRAYIQLGKKVLQTVHQTFTPDIPVKGDKPKDDRNSATKIEKQYKEKEAKRLALEKAKRIQMQKDTKDKEAKRFAIKKAKIEAFFEKHRPCTLKTPDEVSTLGTGKNAKVDGQEGTEKGKPQHKKATKDRLKRPTKRVRKPKMPKKVIWIHYWVIRWQILQQV